MTDDKIKKREKIQMIFEKLDEFLESIPVRERYISLAEEATELAQAALKMTRINNPDNPCPIDKQALTDNLIEEFNDVLLDAYFILDLDINFDMILAKIDRWKKRLDDSRSKHHS